MREQLKALAQGDLSPTDEAWLAAALLWAMEPEEAATLLAEWPDAHARLLAVNSSPLFPADCRADLLLIVTRARSLATR